MIGILSDRTDDIFLDKLDLPFKTVDTFDPKNPLNVDGLFIDWVPKTPAYEDAWMKQASLLQGNIKTGMPIVIFDRGISLTEKEVKWCRKFNTYLFEPALNSGRTGFDYLPEWTSALEINLDDEDREYDLVYSSPNVEYYLKEFERWFKEFSRLFPDKKVAFSSYKKMSDFKIGEYKDENLVMGSYPLFNEGNFTVAIDVDLSYQIGYLNPLYFFAMVSGCLPILPIDHKYFHGMFKNLIAKDIKELEYYVSLYWKVKNVIIEEIFDRVKTEWPEFTVDHAASVIRNCYE